MAPYNRRMNMQRRPEAEVVHIDPPKPPVVLPKSNEEHKQRKPMEKNFLSNLLPGNFEAEDWMLLGLMMLFLQSENEEYSMMLPALLYIFLG